MNANITENENLISVDIDGRLDTANAIDFEQLTIHLHGLKNTRIEIDCSRMVYICSMGLRVFISLLKSAQKNNTALILRGMRPDIREVFEMTGFSSLFHILP